MAKPEMNLALGIATMATLFAVAAIVVGSIALDKAVDASNNHSALVQTLAKFTPRTFIYRPGFNGPLVQGLFSTWDALYPNLHLVPGPKTIFFDASDGLLTIPASDQVYDMTNVVWIAPNILFGLSPTRVVLTIADGATLTNLTSISGSILVTYNHTTKPCMVRSVSTVPNPAPSSLNLSNGAAILCVSQPFVQVQSGLFTLVMDNQAAIIPNTPVVIPSLQSSTSAAGQGLMLWVGDGCTLPPNSLSGTGNIICVNQSLTATLSQTQPSAIGSLMFLDNVSANNMMYMPAVVGNWSGTAPSSVANALDRIAAQIGPIT